jgi:gas vesicle protein
MKNLDIVLALIGGTLAGVTLGLLCAPDSGRNTRLNILKCIQSRCRCHTTGQCATNTDAAGGNIEE